MEVKDALKAFLDLEQEKGLYDYQIGSIVLWNLYRAPYRGRYISHAMEVRRRTNKESKWSRIHKELLYFFYSITRLLKLLIRHEKYDNVLFPFGRLQMNEGEYFDKFTDPVIDLSTLSESFCVFQLPCVNNYKGKRRHEDRVIPIDSLYTLSYCLMPFYFVKHVFTGGCQKIYKLYSSAKQITPLSKKDIIIMNTIYMRIRLMAIFYSFILQRLEAKRVFYVGRRAFMDVTYSAHKLQIPVYEFQHGVTHGETDYYSGPTCPAIDPDFFLSFGSMWKGNQFGIDPQKIINIGWAYKDEIVSSGKETIPNSVLFISSPLITFKILKTAKDLSEKNPQFRFYIRCHPYEKYTEEQMLVINSIDNLFLDDNSKDSQTALCHYEFVIGENSSVVYEALSLGKRVGRLCYNDITSARLPDIEDDGFVYLYNDDDFSKLIAPISYTCKNEPYSDFKPEIVDSLRRKD